MNEGFEQTCPSQVGPVYALVRSWNRPLYLWACLDSLYRGTTHPCRFVLIDNDSCDRTVRQIVDGFERRKFFHGIHFFPDNRPANAATVLSEYGDSLGKYVILLDADVVVERTDPCWLSRLIAIAEADPELGIVGSYLDKSDFVDREFARTVDSDISDDVLDDLIKARSPERDLPVSDQATIDPFCPAGRLLLVRTEILKCHGLPVGNARVRQAAAASGYRTCITTKVKHRHLSLLHLFDYPDYDYQQLRRFLQG